jgi:hypothetical protein
MTAPKLFAMFNSLTTSVAAGAGAAAAAAGARPTVPAGTIVSPGDGVIIKPAAAATSTSTTMPGGTSAPGGVTLGQAAQVAGTAAAEEASEEAAEAASGETAEATPEQPAETSAAPNEADHEKAQQGNVNVVADSGLAVGAQDLYTTNPTDGQVGECKASEQDNNDFLRSESPNSSVESLQMMDHGLRNAQYQEQADKIEYILNPINEWFEDVKSRGNLLVSDPLEALDQGISNTYPFLDQITQQDVIQALEQAGVYEEGGILDRQAFDGLVSALPLPGGLGITRGIFNRAPNNIDDILRASSGSAGFSTVLSTERAQKWQRYLERRGINFEIGTPSANLKLFDKGEYLPDGSIRPLEGLFSGGRNGGTIYLPENPSTSAFFEEAFHAQQHLRNDSLTKIINGRKVDAWEYDAKQSLLKYSEKLGLTYDEFIEIERQLQRVLDGTYRSF